MNGLADFNQPLLSLEDLFSFESAEVGDAVFSDVPPAVVDDLASGLLSVVLEVVSGATKDVSYTGSKNRAEDMAATDRNLARLTYQQPR